MIDCRPVHGHGIANLRTIINAMMHLYQLIRELKFKAGFSLFENKMLKKLDFDRLFVDFGGGQLGSVMRSCIHYSDQF